MHVDMDATGVEHGWTRALIGVGFDTGLPYLENMNAFTTLGWCNVRVLLIIYIMWFDMFAFYQSDFLS